MRFPFFVVDATGLAGLPRINAEDISYVVVNEKLMDMFNKMEVMNDAMLPIRAVVQTINNTSRKCHNVISMPKL